MPNLAELMRQKLKEQEKQEKIITKPEFITKNSLQETKKISPKISKPVEKESYSKSLELNLIKCLYANRFGSTTNKLKVEMQNTIINEWKKKT